MKLYHGCDDYAWGKIQNEGVLWGLGGDYNPDDGTGSRYTYLTPRIEFASLFGPVVLEVEIDNPEESPSTNGEYRTTNPIPLSQVKRVPRVEQEA